MPLYDYKCPKCGDEQERFVAQRESAPTYIACPLCLSWMPRLQFSVPAPAQFKGTGWYASDYKEKK